MPNDSLLLAAEDETVSLALAGLTARRKTLPPKLFYDPAGCRLFYEITRLPEYYLTRTELGLLREFAPKVARMIPGPAVLVEYGASDETKARLLLDQRNEMGERVFAAYVPVDVAAGALDALADRIARSDGPGVFPVAADFTDPLILPEAANGLARFGLFPGSTIGNLDPAQARRFLRQARATLGDGARMLVGVDLRKDPEILVRAYNDSAGVTAAFNLNLLARLNREAGADFDLAGFAHRAIWNRHESRIEMHLVSRREQMVHIGGMAIRFARGETIHTENSYKYGRDDFTRLAEQSGWQRIGLWTDAAELFSLDLLSADGGWPVSAKSW